MLIMRTEREKRRDAVVALATDSKGRLDRRTFLRRSGLAAGGLAMLGTLPVASVRKAEAGPPPAPGAAVTRIPAANAAEVRLPERLRVYAQRRKCATRGPSGLGDGVKCVCIEPPFADAPAGMADERSPILNHAGRPVSSPFVRE